MRKVENYMICDSQPPVDIRLEQLAFPFLAT